MFRSMQLGLKWSDVLSRQQENASKVIEIAFKVTNNNCLHFYRVRKSFVQISYVKKAQKLHNVATFPLKTERILSRQLNLNQLH